MAPGTGTSTRWRQAARAAAALALAAFCAACSSDYTRAAASAQPSAEPVPAQPAPPPAAAASAPAPAPAPSPEPAAEDAPPARWAASAVVTQSGDDPPFGVRTDLERDARRLGLAIRPASGADLVLRVRYTAQDATTYSATERVVNWRLTVEAVNNGTNLVVDTLPLDGAASGRTTADARLIAQKMARSALSRASSAFVDSVTRVRPPDAAGATQTPRE